MRSPCWNSNSPGPSHEPRRRSRPLPPLAKGPRPGRGRACPPRSSRLRRQASSKRNAELVEQLKAYGKYAHDTTLEDQNAELVAALRPLAMVAKYCGQINDSTGVWSHTSIIDGEHFSLTIGDCRRASATLARAESATPDKQEAAR